MYRHNGGLRGKKAANNFVSTIKSLELPRGRMNGGILGGGGTGDRLSDNLEDNVDNTSGIWDIDGLVLVDEDVTTIVTVDTSYYRQDPPYQVFNETSRTVHVTGYWYTGCPDGIGAPCNSIWGCQGDLRSSGNNGAHSWISFGSGCSNPWVYEAYNTYGYYSMYTPPPVYVPQSEQQSSTTTYKVWNFFA